MIGLIKIEVSEADAERFREFQRYYKNISFLLDHGVFEMHGASAELNFDTNGVIQSITKISTAHRI